jgi:TfoX/Sxy family transcriptional regulator of competence genes
MMSWPQRKIIAVPESMSGKMPKPSEQAKAAFSRLVPGDPSVTMRPMFGNLAAFVNGNMFAGLFGEDLFVRLPDDEAAAIRKAGGHSFEPMAGRAMTGYVVVPITWQKKPDTVRAWVHRALTLTREMPGKVKKPAPAKKPAARKAR